MAPAKPSPAPPKGYRPKLSLRDKLRAALHALGLTEETVEFDHDPPIQMRVWVPERGDTEPAARDHRHIVPRVKAEHREKTSGRRTKARAEGDQTEIAKTKRMASEQERFRKRILSKGEQDPPPKRNWPKRPVRLKRAGRKISAYPKNGLTNS